MQASDKKVQMEVEKGPKGKRTMATKMISMLAGAEAIAFIKSE